jgi:hypothetical protein
MQIDLSIAEEEINIMDAAHTLAISDLLASKSFAASNGDAQKKNEFLQSINAASSVLNQADSQAVQVANQNLSQSFSITMQQRSTALQVCPMPRLLPTSCFLKKAQYRRTNMLSRKSMQKVKKINLH